VPTVKDRIGSKGFHFSEDGRVVCRIRIYPVASQDRHALFFGALLEGIGGTDAEGAAIIDDGRIVALDTPDNLKDAVGGDLVSLRAENNEAATQELRERYRLSPQVQNGIVTFSVPHGEEFLPDFMRTFPLRLLSIGIRRPTLDDVFLKLTGRAIREQEADSWEQMRRWVR